MLKQTLNSEPRSDRFLSKSDLVKLLEIADLAISGKKQRHSIDYSFRKLQNLIPFEQGLLVRSNLFTSDPRQGFIFWNFNDSVVDEYFSRHCYKIDPIAVRLLETMDFVDIAQLYDKNRHLKTNPVCRMHYEFNLKTGLADIICDNDRMQTTGFALYRVATKLDQRIKTLTRWILPFFAVIYDKTRDQDKTTKRSFNLTRKETEVLKWLKEGKTSWEISMILDISERTVNFHVANLMRKLNATKRMQAVALAVGNGLIEL